MYRSIYISYVKTINYLRNVTRKLSALVYRTRSICVTETAMPAQGTLSSVHRAQKTQLAARGGERLAALPVSQGTSMPETAHGSWLAPGEILRRCPRDQDLQRLLHTLPSFRRSDLRYLKRRGVSAYLRPISTTPCRRREIFAIDAWIFNGSLPLLRSRRGTAPSRSVHFPSRAQRQSI